MTDIYCNYSNFDVKNSNLPTWRILFNTPNRSSDLINDYSEEIWNDVVGYEGKYKISSFGRIQSKVKSKDWKLMKTFFKDGYCKISLYKNGKSNCYFIHRLSALTFIQNHENKPYVNHKNGIKNDNRVENLEWVTESENSIHAYKVLNKNTKSRNGKKIYQYDLEGNFISEYSSVVEAAIKNNIKPESLHSFMSSKWNSLFGFVWSYNKLNSEWFQNKNFGHNDKWIKVEKLVNNEVIEIYDSKMKAEKANNLYKGALVTHLKKGITKTFGEASYRYTS